MQPANVVREVRRQGGLSQRALAELAGTSGPTIADYESGRKEPKLSTLERIASAAGFHVEVSLSPTEHERALSRQRSLRVALAAATAMRVREDWPRARAVAEHQLQLMAQHARGGASAKGITAWRVAVEAGPETVERLLLQLDEDGDDLRQMTPFAGLLSDDERRLVLSAAVAARG